MTSYGRIFVSDCVTRGYSWEVKLSSQQKPFHVRASVSGWAQCKAAPAAMETARLWCRRLSITVLSEIVEA